MVSMIPFGLLAGVVGGREVRITEIDESGFCFRTIEENISDSEALKVCFYDIKNGRYRELEISEYDIQRFDMEDAELSGFCVKYKVTVKQKAYAEAVQRLLYQYNHYIHLKLEEDDSALAKSLTGYPGELDEVKRGSLEEQVGIWRRELTPDGLESAYNGKRIDLTDNCSQYGTGFEPGYKCQVPPESGVAELALEIDRPELYQEYLNSSLTEFSKKYFNKGLKEKVRLTIQGQVLDAAEEKCQETYLMMSYSDQNMGVVIVPDTISFPKESRHASYLLADYSPKYDTKEFRNYMDSDEFRYQKEFTEHELLSVSTQSEIYDESIGSSGVVIFVAIYLGLVFVISGAALLALKELSDAIDGREKYRILQQLGVSEKELGHTLFLQMAVFFAFPLLLAMIHSIFGIQVCIELLSIYDIKAIIPALLICAAMIVGIYGGYFLLSYRGCKRIIITKRIR